MAGCTRSTGFGVTEAGLYPGVKRFLLGRGYEPKGEVSGCDVVAVRAGDAPAVAVVEMKLGLNLELVLQGVERMPGCDEVWLAVPGTRKGRDRDARARKLCRLLGFGLLAVRGMAVEVLCEPGPYRPRPNLRRRRVLETEHGNRRGDPSPGGTRGVPIETAYRQEALACAARLRDGPLSTRELGVETPRATAILYRNVYGWFERQSRGVYGLTPAGQEALRRRAAV